MIHKNSHLNMSKTNKLSVFFLSTLCLCLIFVSQNSYSQKNIQTFSGKISYKPSDLKIIDKADSKQLLIKSTNQSYTEGTPSLPIVYKAVYIPPNCNFSIQSKTNGVQVFKNIILAKSEPQHIDTKGYVEKKSNEVLDYPITDAWFPAQVVEKHYVLEYRGHRVLILQINPIQYNSHKRVAKVHSNINYKVIFSKKRQFEIQDADFKPSTINRIRQWVVNPEFLNQAISIKNNLVVSYLIITHPNYLEAADSLALWKRECGYKVEILSNNNWVSNSIKDSITQRYNSAASIDYVCFLGDHNLVPGMEVLAPDPLPGTFATDLHYVCMGGAGDFFPDIAYGRISVSNPIEAIHVVRKLVRYERNPPQNTEYYQKVAHCSYFQDDNLDGFDDRRFVQTSEDIRNYLTANFGLSIDRIYEAPSNVNPQNWNNGIYSVGEAIPQDLTRPVFNWSGNTSDIINAFNHGRMYVYHRDHGYSNATGWAHPHLASDQIQYVFNLNNLPLVLSINCHSGEFYQNECFAEKMMRSTSGGAFGIYAPASFSYSGFNDAFSMGIINGFWNSPGLNPTFTGSGGSANPDIDNALVANKAGDVLVSSLIFKTLHWGFNQHSNRVMHFFGDPAVTFYNSEPQNIEYFSNDTIFCNSGFYQILTQNCNQCFASITKNQKWISGGQIINDTLSLSFLPDYGDSAILTIVGKDKRPVRKKLVWHCQSGIQTPIANFRSSSQVSCNNSIQFTDESIHMPDSFVWDFGDGNFSTNQNPTHVYNQAGNFNVKLTVQNSFGRDSLTKHNFITSHTPTPPIFSDTLLCAGGQISLFANASQKVYWYDNNQNILDSGNILVINNIDLSTFYFPKTINYLTGSTLGKIDNSGNGGYIFANKKHYLVFQSFENVMLENVTIYSNASGNKIVELQDSVGNVLHSKIHSFSIGINQVNLQFPLEKNKRYRLSGPIFANFFANNDSVFFPYQIENVIKIDSSSADQPLSTYYYFYKWQIGRYCHSQSDTLNVEIIDVNPNIYPSGMLMLCPNIQEIDIQTMSGMDALWQNNSFSNQYTAISPGNYFAQQQYFHCTLYSDTLQIVDYQLIYGDVEIDCQNQNCNFTFNGDGVFQYNWDFGDGNTSSHPSPVHQFADSGNYIVRLKIMNNCDTLYIEKNLNIISANIQSNDFQNIKIIQTSLSNRLYIVNPHQKNYRYSITSIEGKIIQKGSTNEQHIQIDLSDFAKGVYILTLIEDEKLSHYKLISG